MLRIIVGRTQLSIGHAGLRRSYWSIEAGPCLDTVEGFGGSCGDLNRGKTEVLHMSQPLHQHGLSECLFMTIPGYDRDDHTYPVR